MTAPPPLPALDGTLSALQRWIPDALVPPEALAAVSHTASALPAALTRELYLEARLGAPGAVDLVVHVEAEGRDLLAGVRGPTPRIENDALWAARLRRFCRAWAEPASPLNRDVSGLWLEFDVPPEGAPAACPGIFVNLGWAADRGASPKAWTATAALALEQAAGVSVGENAWRSMAHCVAALPPDARMLYAGAFPGRGCGAVRLCAQGIPAKAVEPWLRAIGWRGGAGEMEMLRGVLDAGGAAPGMVHVDVAHGIGSRIGIELPLERRPQLDGRIAEALLISRLVDMGLCDAGRGDALRGWPGWTRMVLPHQLWPSLLVRRVNHVKVVMGDGEPHAKAYLCAWHTHRRRAALGNPGGSMEGDFRDGTQPQALRDADELSEDDLEQVAGGLARVWVHDVKLPEPAPVPTA